MMLKPSGAWLSHAVTVQSDFTSQVSLLWSKNNNNTHLILTSQTDSFSIIEKNTKTTNSFVIPQQESR